MVMDPARKVVTRRVPRVHRKILRLTCIHPISTYFFFFLTGGPSSQLLCVASSGRRRVERSSSWRLRLRSSSVIESAALISKGPPHGSRPYIVVEASLRAHDQIYNKTGKAISIWAREDL